MLRAFEHLLTRSWGAMISASSTSTFGFFCWMFGAAVVIGLAQIAYSRFTASGDNKPGWLGAVERTWKPVLLEIGALTLFTLTVWFSFVVRTVYFERTGMRWAYTKEVMQNSALTRELDLRKEGVVTTDPSFVNVIYLLQSFQIYRESRHGRPCVIYVTATPDSTPLASVVAQFSNSVSGCSTFGPDAVGNPDLDDMAKDGMVPGVILVHIKRDDKSGLSLQEHLGNQIQTRLSYQPPKIPKDHLYAGSPYGYTQDFVWLQFGAGVTWNSELFRREKNP